MTRTKPLGNGTIAEPALSVNNSETRVALLTGGIDRSYTFGLAMELSSKGVCLDLIGSDFVDFPQFHGNPQINFLNLQGSQQPDVSSVNKTLRLLAYYFRLVRYAASAKPRIFHILWNNKFHFLDRTLLMLYFQWSGKKIVLTVHNVNKARRDSKDSFFNRFTLLMQYRLAQHIFVHTGQMKCELIQEFGVRDDRITVIPFGINNSLQDSPLSQAEARQRLGIYGTKKVILFFGRIAPYKGLQYLLSAFQQISIGNNEYQLVIAGRPENDYREFWNSLLKQIGNQVNSGDVVIKAEYIPDDETEVYFKAADVLVLPYKQIYQSGVLFLGQSFGLPVIVSDIGSLRDDILEGENGFVFSPGDAGELAEKLISYFKSDLYKNLPRLRHKIKHDAARRHSWDHVGSLTTGVYEQMLSSS